MSDSRFQPDYENFPEDHPSIQGMLEGAQRGKRERRRQRRTFALGLVSGAATFVSLVGLFDLAAHDPAILTTTLYPTLINTTAEKLVTAGALVTAVVSGTSAVYRSIRR